MVRPPPPLMDDQTMIVSFRLPRSMVAWLDERAGQDQTRTDVLKEIVSLYIWSQGEP